MIGQMTQIQGTETMTQLTLGGYTQDLTAVAPRTFSRVLYGMITNLPQLTSGTTDKPGWSPSLTKAPSAPAGCQVLWIYGGAGAQPSGYPDSGSLASIVSATTQNGWDGVDFDDESALNVPMVGSTMTGLKQAGKATSFDFVGGWGFTVGPDAAANQQIVRDIAATGQCDAINMMCYGGTMWTDWEMSSFIPTTCAAARSAVNGNSRLMLGITTRGLTSTNLQFALDQVKSQNLNGIMVFAFEELAQQPALQAQLEAGLGLT
jgi:hypothetical protein